MTIEDKTCPTCGSTKTHTLGVFSVYIIDTETPKDWIWTLGCDKGHTWKVTEAKESDTAVER